MLNRKTFVFILVNIVLAGLIGGCMGRSEPARFYTLTSTVEDSRLSANNVASNLTIGIGPIKLADYLKQSKIVTRVNDNKLDQAEFDKWSGSFNNNIINVLAENISNLLGTEKIVVYPWRSFIPIDYQIVVNIIRFDGKPGDQATLMASWIIIEAKEKSILSIKRSDIIEPIDSSGYAGLVAAQSRALGQLSTQITQSMNDLFQQK